MEWVIRNAVAAFLLPPGFLLVVACWGWWMMRRRPRTGKSLVVLSFVGLYALSMPYVGDSLLQAIEAPLTDPLADRRGEAIVVLGGGKYHGAPEYGGDTVSRESLARLRYGARLHRVLDKPILVTGGSPEGSATSEAWAMKTVLAEAFGVPVAWVEERSRTTLENARFSHVTLAVAGVNTVYLVTDAWHMPRAQLAFERAGVTVIPAPTNYATRYRLTVLDFVPSAGALRDSSRFFHEIIGIAWYRLRFVIGG